MYTHVCAVMIQVIYVKNLEVCMCFWTLSVQNDIESYVNSISTILEDGGHLIVNK